MEEVEVPCPRYPVSGRDPSHCVTHHICDCLAHKLMGLEDRETVQTIQQRVKEWAAYNFPNAPTYQPLLGAGEELGELYHSFLKRQQRIRGTADQHRKAEQDAIGDLLIYLMDFANREGYDVQECLLSAWNEIADRDWQRFPENGKTA